MQTELLNSGENENPKKNEMVLSHISLRTTLGILGITLPLVIYLIRGEVLPSISLYYYTKSSVFLTSILISFGLFLISYKGYVKKANEKISDNVVTTIGGIFVIAVAIIPTSCKDIKIEGFCDLILMPEYPLLGHQSDFYETIHLLSALFFFISMGVMSFFQFSKGNRTRYNKAIFKWTGIIIFFSVGILLIKFLIIKVGGNTDFRLFKNDTFWFEVIALEAFGFAWLLKCHLLKKISNSLSGYFFSKKLSNES